MKNIKNGYNEKKKKKRMAIMCVQPESLYMKCLTYVLVALKIHLILRVLILSMHYS